jgi:hypothetical protein
MVLEFQKKCRAKFTPDDSKQSCVTRIQFTFFEHLHLTTHLDDCERVIMEPTTVSVMISQYLYMYNAVRKLPAQVRSLAEPTMRQHDVGDAVADRRKEQASST